ncbi:MAG: recombinase RecX [Rhodothermaceae bacterium]|nr:recombinase RecX [Rhodothermaceae bacterium]
MPDLAPDEQAPDLRAGTVTRVVQQKRDGARVSVFIDEQFAFGLALDLAVEAGLRKGMALTVKAQEALLAKEQTHRARAAALNYLSYQARTAQEVRRKLRTKDFADDVVEDAVAHLETYGYLDDEAYARAYARGRFAGRGYGPQRLRMELRKRGVASETIETVLDELEEAEDVGATAERHARKRWQALARETDPRKRMKKTIDFLVRRGFAYGLAREVVDVLAREEEDFDAAASEE